MLGDRPPPLDLVRDTMAIVNRTWLPEPGRELSVGVVDEAMVLTAREHRVARDSHARDYEAMRMQIRDRMANATVMTSADGNVLARIDGRGTLTFPTPKEKTA